MSTTSFAVAVRRWPPHYIVWVVLILAFGTWLRWPSLTAGFFSDDFVAAAMAEGTYAAPRGKLDLFNFTSGTPDDYARLTRVGSLPWWSVPGLRLSMLRPLSSALVLLDRQLFGDDAFLCHLHSLLWWLAAMLMAAVLLRELFPVPIASCALALFAVEQGHTLPLGWLANRGTLVAIVFCLAGVRAPTPLSNPAQPVRRLVCIRVLQHRALERRVGVSVTRLRVELHAGR